MKPNDKALDEALSVTQIPEEDMRGYMRRVLTAAYAAQFQSEDYVGFVKELRSINTQWRLLDVDKYEELCNEAADALDAVLAELKAQKEYNEVLTCKKLTDLARGAERYWEARWRDEAKENDKLKAELAKAQEITRMQAERIGWYINEQEKRDAVLKPRTSLAEAAAKERDALLARLAPVEDKALVEIVARAICLVKCELAFRCKEDGVCKAPVGNFCDPNYVQPVSLGSSWQQSRAAIAAIRPHIEAAERERCAKAVITVAKKINVAPHERPAYEDGYLQGVHDAAAAIRSGK